MEKYRFDDTYQKVYEYDNEGKCYLFVGTYFAFGISASMPTNKKIRIVTEELNI